MTLVMMIEKNGFQNASSSMRFDSNHYCTNQDGNQKHIMDYHLDEMEFTKCYLYEPNDYTIDRDNYP